MTQEQLETLAGNLAAGYQSYAQANGLPDPAQIGVYFTDYLNTEDAQSRLTQGLSSMIDTGSLRDQISQSMESYMQQVMASYSGTLGQALQSQISSAMEQMMGQLSSAMETAMTQAIAQIGENLQSAMNIDAEAFSNAFKVNMDGDEMAELFMSMNSTQDATYEENLRNLGYVDFDVPSGISIYPKDFESKEYVVDILDSYNSRMEAEGKDEQVITYTDVVGTLMSSVTDIIDIISYVLIAFVAISLVVSSIMIGVITYISVLERKKEIGILRAIGASKGNISQLRRTSGNRHHLIAADTGQRSDPPSGRNQQYQCGTSASAGSGPDPAQCDPDFDRRTDPLQKGGQERSGDSPENGIGRSFTIAGNRSKI